MAEDFEKALILCKKGVSLIHSILGCCGATHKLYAVLRFEPGNSLAARYLTLCKKHVGKEACKFTPNIH